MRIRISIITFVAAFGLVLGATHGARGQATGTTTYIVRPGDTLFRIAERELGDGRLWQQIAETNGIADPSRISVGMRLVLPSSVAAESDSSTIAVRAEDAPESTEARSDVLRETTPPPPGIATPEAESAPLRRDLPAWLSSDGATQVPSTARIINTEADAVDLALRENRELKALAADIERTRAGLTTARIAGRFNPEVEGSMGRRVIPADEPDAPTERFNEWGVEVWQEMEIAGQRGHRMSVAELELERSRAEAEGAEREIILGVRSAYAGALVARDFAALARRREAARLWIAEAAGWRYEAGDAARIEVDLANAEAARATADREAAEADHEAALARLATALGLDSSTPLAITERLDPAPTTFSTDLSTLALAERRDLRITLIDIRLAEARGRLARAEGSPNLRLGVGYEREERATDVYSVRVGIPLPLFNPRMGDVQAAKAEGDAAIERAEALKRRIRGEVAAALSRVNGLERRRTSLQRGVEAGAEERLRLIAEAYGEGKLGFSQLLVYMDEALASREAILEVNREMVEAILDLERATGGTISTGGRGR